MILVLVAAAVGACYLPTLSNGFVWDDTYNYTGNDRYRGLSWTHLKWMWTTFHDGNYHPLVWMSFRLDFVLGGLNPAGYHATNLLLHLANAVGLYFLILAFLRPAQVNGGREFVTRVSAAVGALFFAVHPLRVEAVAWLSARGDLLCGFFYLLTILGYLRMAAAQADAGRRRRYGLTLLFFGLSLLSRAWGMTLPLLLLLLDLYPLNRWGPAGGRRAAFRRIVLEKVPFAILALGAALLALAAKKGSMLSVAEHGVVNRILQAAYGLCFYLGKTILPAGLSPSYILDQNIRFLAPRFVLCLLGVAGFTAALVFMRRRWPWALAAWSWYAVTVSPLLGLVQSGPQIAADRYTYIACLPFAVLAAAGVQRLWIAGSGLKRFSPGRLGAMAVIGTGLIVLGVMSFRQTRIWRDDLVFWNYVLDQNPRHYMAYNNRGVFFQERMKALDKALQDYTAAIDLYPEYVEAYYNRGLLHELRGDLEAAAADYSRIVKLDPRHARAYNNRGAIRRLQGDSAAALKDFDRAILLAPLSPEAYANRAMLRLSQNDLAAAVDDLVKALAVAPEKWGSGPQVKSILQTVRQQGEKQAAPR